MTSTDHPDRQAVLTVLTTEHFALQGGRGSTVSESGTRSALYVGAVSSGLVALGFVDRGGEDRATFNGFALVILPTLYLLGLFTFVRLVQNSIEDMFLGRAINRIRRYYFSVIGDDSGYVMLDANDDPRGVLAKRRDGAPVAVAVVLHVGDDDRRSQRRGRRERGDAGGRRARCPDRRSHRRRWCRRRHLDPRLPPVAARCAHGRGGANDPLRPSVGLASGR
jgi:hypothetical protein